MAVFILAGIMIYNVRLGVVSISSFLLASLISIGLKEIFFDDENRPFFIFTYYEHLKLKLVNGVQPFIHNTFPSGHATQAFAIFSILLFFSERLSIKIIFLFIAILTAFSRVYLSQHWMNDIVAGSCIGMFFAIFFYFFLIEKNKLNTVTREGHRINFFLTIESRGSLNTAPE